MVKAFEWGFLHLGREYSNDLLALLVFTLAYAVDTCVPGKQARVAHVMSRNRHAVGQFAIEHVKRCPEKACDFVGDGGGTDDDERPRHEKAPCG